MFHTIRVLRLSAPSPSSNSVFEIPLKQAREARQLWPLCLDAALEVPATAHCRNMCEHGFLSHWDITGRKPYQRYSDFAYGQHVSEVVFGFDLGVATESEVRAQLIGE